MLSEEIIIVLDRENQVTRDRGRMPTTSTTWLFWNARCGSNHPYQLGRSSVLRGFLCTPPRLRDLRVMGGVQADYPISLSAQMIVLVEAGTNKQAGKMRFCTLIPMRITQSLIGKSPCRNVVSL